MGNAASFKWASKFPPMMRPWLMTDDDCPGRWGLLHRTLSPDSLLHSMQVANISTQSLVGTTVLSMLARRAGDSESSRWRTTWTVREGRGRCCNSCLNELSVTVTVTRTVIMTDSICVGNTKSLGLPRWHEANPALATAWLAKFGDASTTENMRPYWWYTGTLIRITLDYD